MQAEIIRHVEKGAELFTDAWVDYGGLEAEYIYQVIDHAEEYVRGNIHTNSVENFWSFLKRAIKGTYVRVEPFHLFRYLDEQTFRFNNRQKKNDGERFRKVTEQVTGKRLTYTELTGKLTDNDKLSSH